MLSTFILEDISTLRLHNNHGWLKGVQGGQSHKVLVTVKKILT